MFIITRGDGTDGTTDGDGTTGVGPATTDMEDGMTLSGDQVGDGTTGAGMLDGAGMPDGAGPDTTGMVADGTIHIIITMAITGIITALIAGEDITEMLLQIPQTGHTPGIPKTIEEIQILPIIEEVQTQPITGEAQILHTVEEATTIVIIQAEETAETQILPIAIAEG